MELSEKDIKTLKTVSLVAGIFALLLAVMMLFGYVQLKRIDPLDNPALLQLKEQFDRDPENSDLQEQIRSLDLIARKAFFTATWQVRAGSYLLLASAIVFILALWLMSSADKTIPVFPGDTTNETSIRKIKRQWLLAPVVLIFAAAIIASAVMRKNLPSPGRVTTAEEVQVVTMAETVAATPAIRQVPAETIQPEAGSAAETPSAVGTASQQPATAATQPDPNLKSEIVNLTSEISAPGTTFPFFRGPGARGFAGGSNYPLEWNGSTGKNILWKTETKKGGFNSPVIWGNRLFITGADESGEEIYCYSVTDGKLLWTARAGNIAGAPATPPETTEDTGLAAPTAAANGEVVCAIFGTGNLICADHNGKIVWAKNLGVPDNHYGHSSSLVIYNNMVIVQFDHNVSATLLAFNTRTGEKIWETVRTGAKISWASPVIARLNGKDQVILNSDPYVAGYDLTTGAEIWRARGVSAEIGPSPGVNSTTVFIGNEFAKLVAVKPSTGETQSLWEDNEFTPEISSLVATEDHLFVATSYGAVACYDARTGKVLWENYFDYEFYSSPIIAGDKVYLTDVPGNTYIVKAAGEFDLLATASLGERVYATPAFAHGKIFIRGVKHIYCIGTN
ncbi:MAG: PQQ-binding-like beta-propeller repeat protein [Bacteroidales bacterium]